MTMLPRKNKSAVVLPLKPTLEDHLVECEDRYQQLIERFDQVDDRFDRLEQMLIAIKQKLN